MLTIIMCHMMMVTLTREVSVPMVTTMTMMTKLMMTMINDDDLDKGGS